MFKRLDEPFEATGQLLVQWPNSQWREHGGSKSWNTMPKEGYRGQIVHNWVPFHPRRECRSHAGVIYLVRHFFWELSSFLPFANQLIVKIKEQKRCFSGYDKFFICFSGMFLGGNCSLFV